MLVLGIDFNNSISSEVNIFPVFCFMPNFPFKGRFPSTIINSGVGFNFKIHSCMAFMEAFKILISSISVLCMWVTENETAVVSIIGFNFSRIFSDNCLESLSKVSSNSVGSKMAAAVTGPAKHPLPASSVPHSKTKLL